MKLIIKNIRLIAMFVLAVSFTGCTEDDVILPKVIAGFTYELDAETGTVEFINTSENARSYEWNLGDETASTEKNPVRTYATGSYTVVLKSANVAGASDTFEDIIMINIPLPLALPITFDEANVNYAAEVFSGVAFETVDNPAPGGTNDVASVVGAITNIGAAFEGLSFELGTAIDLATNKTIKMNFWADVAVDVLLKIEEGTASTGDVFASHTGSGWEELSFNFTESASYSKLVLFVDGPGSTAGTFYMDDVMQIETPIPPCTDTDLLLPIDFDCNGIDFGTKIIGNVSFEVVDNVELSGINATASKVGKITNVGANWENSFFNLDAPIDFTTDKVISLKLYSTEALPIKLKLEDGTGADIEVDVNHTGSGWEELNFEFNSTDSYNDMVLFVDGPGTAAGTFYIDDIIQIAGSGTGGGCTDDAQTLLANDLNLTFVTDPGTAAAQGTELGKFYQDNVAYEYVDNPNTGDAVNTSCKVGKVTNGSVEAWDNLQIDFADKFVIEGGATFKMKVYSPESGYKVTIKLEDKADAGIAKEFPSTQATTLTNGWEELTFTLDTDSSNKYNRVVLFFDLQTTNANTYYFDDLVFDGGSGGGGGGGGACAAAPAGELLPNGDFEADTCWQYNANGGTVERSNADANGGAFSAKLITGANQAPNIKVERFASSMAAGTTIQVTFKYKFTTALGTGSILQVLGFSEKTAGAVEHNMGNASDMPLNTWNTFTGTFVTASDIAEGLSLLLQLTGSGNADGGGEVFIDDVQVTQL